VCLLSLWTPDIRRRLVLSVAFVIAKIAPRNPNIVAINVAIQRTPISLLPSTFR
jgi:hypothetical protein